MNCPNCGQTVPDGAFECPSCHGQLGLTQRIVIPKESWCPVCGALVAPGSQSCPKCGSPMGAERPQTRSYRKIRLPEISEGVSDASSTGELRVARIESAIPPSTPDPTSPVARHDRLPQYAGVPGSRRGWPSSSLAARPCSSRTPGTLTSSPSRQQPRQTPPWLASRAR